MYLVSGFLATAGENIYLLSKVVSLTLQPDRAGIFQSFE
jgi:hypothetical protein